MSTVTVTKPVDNPIPPPLLVSVTPSTGDPAGGESVTISGGGFRLGAAVTFGGVSATGIDVQDGATIVCTTPAHAEGAVDVVVTNVDEQSDQIDNGFTYDEEGGGGGDPEVLFYSGWDHALGATRAAVRDGTKWNDNGIPEEEPGGLVLEVVATASEWEGGGPTTNALKVKWFDSDFTMNVEKAVDAPEMEDRLWHRVWKRVPSGQDWEAGEGIFHGHNFTVGGMPPIQAVFFNLIGGATGWTTQIRISSANGVPSPSGQRQFQYTGELDYDVTYLLEMQRILVGEGQVQLWPYIMSEDGETEIAGPDDWENIATGTGDTLPLWYAAGNYISIYADGIRTVDEVFRSFCFGHEGPAFAAGDPRHFYFMGPAMGYERLGTIIP